MQGHKKNWNEAKKNKNNLWQKMIEKLLHGLSINIILNTSLQLSYNYRTYFKKLKTVSSARWRYGIILAVRTQAIEVKKNITISLCFVGVVKNYTFITWHRTAVEWLRDVLTKATTKNTEHLLFLWKVYSLKPNTMLTMMLLWRMIYILVGLKKSQKEVLFMN